MKETMCMWALVTAMIFSFGITRVHAGAPLDDAKALADKAAAYWKANGKEKALAELNNAKGQFVKGELYVVAQDFNGVVLANAVNPERIGQNYLELKDPNGKYFCKEIIQVARTKGTGIVEFVFVNPVTKKFQPKTNYIKRVEGADVALICGIFH